jgi:hypothetical protein
VYILVLLTVSYGALLSDKSLSQHSFQLVYVQDFAVYPGPANGLQGPPVRHFPSTSSSLCMFRMLLYILVLLTVYEALLSDETLSQRFLQLCMFKMLLYILVLLMVSGAFLVDEMLSWCSLQPVYVQDASVYIGPADRIRDAPVR